MDERMTISSEPRPQSAGGAWARLKGAAAAGAILAVLAAAPAVHAQVIGPLTTEDYAALGVSLAEPRCTEEILAADDTYCYSYSDEANAYCYHGLGKDVCYASADELRGAGLLAAKPSVPTLGSTRSAGGVFESAPTTRSAGGARREEMIPPPRPLTSAAEIERVGLLEAFRQVYDRRYEAIARLFQPQTPCRAHLRDTYRQAIGRVSGRFDESRPRLSCDVWGSAASAARQEACATGSVSEDFSVECVAARLEDVAFYTYELQITPMRDIVADFSDLYFASQSFDDADAFAREMSCLIESLSVTFQYSCSDAAMRFMAVEERMQEAGRRLGAYTDAYSESTCTHVYREICTQVRPILEDAREAIRGVGQPIGD